MNLGTRLKDRPRNIWEDGAREAGRKKYVTEEW